MKGRCLGLGLLALALAGCTASHRYEKDDYRAREHSRSSCVDLAHEQGYRRVEVQSVKSIGAEVGPGTWEVMMRGVASTGREVKLACEFDGQRRRAAVSRVD